MKYYVTYRINARYVAEVDADNLDEAKVKACDKYIDADFGDSSDIDGEIVVIEDENGNYVWEK